MTQNNEQTETALPLNTTPAGTPSALSLQERFRQLRHKVLMAEKGDYTPLLPGWELIPKADLPTRLAEALKKVTHEQFQLIHAMQTASTGPRKKSTTSPAKQAAATKAAIGNVLDDFI